VKPGEMFELRDGGNKLDANVELTISWKGVQIAFIGFHASCSWPLLQGDQYGSIVVVGFSNTAGVTDQACTKFTGDRNGGGSSTPNGFEYWAHLSCSVPITLGEHWAMHDKGYLQVISFERTDGKTADNCFNGVAPQCGVGDASACSNNVDREVVITDESAGGLFSAIACTGKDVESCGTATGCLWDYKGKMCFDYTNVPTTPEPSTHPATTATPAATTVEVVETTTQASTAAATKAPTITTKAETTTAKSAVCADTKPAVKCVNWKAKDYCKSNSQFFNFMQVYCSSTCGFCSVTAKTSVAAETTTTSTDPVMFDVNDACMGENACTDGKNSLAALTFMYVGANGGSHEQGKKAVASSFKQGTVNVGVTVVGKVPISDLSDDDVSNLAPGQAFTINRAANSMKFSKFLRFQLNEKMNIKIFTTCKPKFPIKVGDQFGSLVVVGFTSRKGNGCTVGQENDRDRRAFAASGHDAVNADADDEAAEIDDATENFTVGVAAGLATMLFVAAIMVVTLRAKASRDADGAPKMRRSTDFAAPSVPTTDATVVDDTGLGLNSHRLLNPSSSNKLRMRQSSQGARVSRLSSRANTGDAC